MGTKLGKIKSEAKQTVKITEKEYSLIKSIWTRIELEPKFHGTGFHVKYFARHPQYIRYFLNDPLRDSVNPDALMVVKFTVIIEILGYLILDFHNKPKQFNGLIGYIGMMHKDMDLDPEDINNFTASLIDYLKDAMSDQMTDACEQVFVAFFRNIQTLMIKSMAEQRRRFDQVNYDDLDNNAVDSRLRALLVFVPQPCTWSNRSNKLIYGQPREYWVLRQQEWKFKLESWRREQQVVTAAINVQNTVESSSSDDDSPENVEVVKQSSNEARDSYPDSESRSSFLLLQRSKYMNNGRLGSTPHFDQLNPNDLASDDDEASDDSDESIMMYKADGRNARGARLTPRERHRVEAVATKSQQPRPSGRYVSSTDTSSARNSEGSSARERRRSTWT